MEAPPPPRITRGNHDDSNWGWGGPNYRTDARCSRRLSLFIERTGNSQQGGECERGACISPVFYRRGNSGSRSRYRVPVSMNSDWPVAARCLHTPCVRVAFTEDSAQLCPEYSVLIFG